MKNTKKILIIAMITIVFAVSIVLAFLLPKLLKKEDPSDTPITLASDVGVWLWDNNADDKYLTFASENNVKEIYYCDSSFSDSTVNFITKANALGIKVYFLAGEYQWVEDCSNLKTHIANYINFNTQNPNASFAGIHLDVEPHQYPDFNDNKSYYLEKYIDFVYYITTTYSSISFDFDIPTWFNTVITFDNNIKEVVQEAFKFVFDYADRVFVMSYRDSAENMISFAEDEIDYAKLIHKKIYLCAETGNEVDKVTFMQESKEYMYSELNKLSDLLDQEYGIAIHNLKTWYDMIDK